MFQPSVHHLHWNICKIKIQYAMHWTGVKACLIKCEPGKSQQKFEKPFPFDNPALMQNVTFSTTQSTRRTMVDEKACSDGEAYTKKIWGKRGGEWNFMHLHKWHKTWKTVLGLDRMHAEWDKHTMAKLKMMLRECAQTQREGSMLLVTTSPGSMQGCGADRAHIAPLVRVSRAPRWVRRRG